MAREILDPTGNEVQATTLARINRMTAELATKWPAAAPVRVVFSTSGQEDWGRVGGALNAMLKAFYAASGLADPEKRRVPLDGTGNESMARTTARLNQMFTELYAV